MLDASGSAHSLTLTDWQKAAGGKKEFDVASVKLSSPNVPPRGMDQLLQFDAPPPNGTFFSANAPLQFYITFAYKITDRSQSAALMGQLPAWAQLSLVTIEARSADIPTRDQLRLMLQSLLENRFKLAIHTEVKQLPVYAVVLDKQGTLGPKLKPHPENESCVVRPGDGLIDARHAGERPRFCGLDEWKSEDGTLHLRMVDVTLDQAASMLSAETAFYGTVGERPFVNRTELAGRYDLNLEFNPQLDSSPDAGGPNIIGAMKKQLGLKLLKQTGSVTAYVISHVEMPSGN